MSKFTIIICIFGIIGFDLSFQISSFETRIVGGQDTKIQDVPYQLSLWYKEKFIGGASIIHLKWAITAAHCVSEKGLNKNDLKVGAGNELKENGIFYKIQTVIIHKLYNKYTADNDIALLEIQNNFNFGSTIRAVNLPEGTFEPSSGLEVIVSGWGYTQTQNKKDSDILKKVSILIVNRDDCKANYKKINRPITKNMICAGDLKQGGKDACINDSGGPMVANNKLYGIVSWGNGCGSKNYPGVYSHVANYINWIKQNMKI